jgi:hypothetical protein
MPADGETFLFTSESVNEGHPDKLCDQARFARPARTLAGKSARCWLTAPRRRRCPTRCWMPAWSRTRTPRRAPRAAGRRGGVSSCGRRLRAPGPPPPQVACESCSKTGMVMVFGEITTKAKVDYEAIVRKTCEEIGFTSEEVR